MAEFHLGERAFGCEAVRNWSSSDVKAMPDPPKKTFWGCSRIGSSIQESRRVSISIVKAWWVRISNCLPGRCDLGGLCGATK